MSAFSAIMFPNIYICECLSKFVIDLCACVSKYQMYMRACVKKKSFICVRVNTCLFVYVCACWTVGTSGRRSSWRKNDGKKRKRSSYTHRCHAICLHTRLARIRFIYSFFYPPSQHINVHLRVHAYTYTHIHSLTHTLTHTHTPVA